MHNKGLYGPARQYYFADSNGRDQCLTGRARSLDPKTVDVVN